MVRATLLLKALQGTDAATPTLEIVINGSDNATHAGYVLLDGKASTIKILGEVSAYWGQVARNIVWAKQTKLTYTVRRASRQR